MLPSTIQSCSQGLRSRSWVPVSLQGPRSSVMLALGGDFDYVHHQLRDHGQVHCLVESQLLQLQNGDSIFYPVEVFNATLRKARLFQRRKTPQVLAKHEFQRTPCTHQSSLGPQLQRAKQSLKSFPNRERILGQGRGGCGRGDTWLWSFSGPGSVL